MHRLTLSAALPLALIACNSSDEAVASGEEVAEVKAISPVDRLPFETAAIATFDEPWAMTFLPDGRALVTEKKGVLKLVSFGADGRPTMVDVSGTPEVAYGGQGGLGDVVLSPDFTNDGYVYLSFAERAKATPAVRPWRGPRWSPPRTAAPA